MPAPAPPHRLRAPATVGLLVTAMFCAPAAQAQKAARKGDAEEVDWRGVNRLDQDGKRI